MWRPAQLRNRQTRGSQRPDAAAGCAPHGGIWFGGRDVRGKAKGDIVKTQEEHMHIARESSHRSDEATDLGIEHPTLDQEAIARLAYFFWEERAMRLRRFLQT